MLEDAPLITAKRSYARPAAELLAALAGTPSGFVVDCMGGFGAFAYDVKPVDATCATFVGTALPCYAGPADNLAVHAALQRAAPGDVIVAATDGYTHTAVIGDLVAGMMRNSGVAAFVTDGLIRDAPGLVAAGLPVFCRGVIANSPARNGPGTVGLAIELAGVHVEAGDVLVGDVDGVVVIPQARLAEVVEKLPALKAAEAAQDKAVAEGLKSSAAAAALLEGRIVEVD